MKRPVPFPVVATACYAVLAGQAAGLLPVSDAVLCPFKLLTGHPCPGCGIGHALLYGLRGDWRASVHAHPLGIPLLVLWTFWLSSGTIDLLRRRPFAASVPFIGRPAFSWAALALVLSVYAVRTLGLVHV